MPMPLIRIVYYSEPERSYGIDMKVLHETCVRNNGRDSIGGFLHYNGYYFLQVLEGERDKVSACYHRIASDPRHTNMVLIGSEVIEQLTYPSWTIGLDVGLKNPTKEVFLEHFASSKIDPAAMMSA
jgi:Sensors of blue-light using FAD